MDDTENQATFPKCKPNSQFGTLLLLIILGNGRYIAEVIFPVHDHVKYNKLFEGK